MSLCAVGQETLSVFKHLANKVIYRTMCRVTHFLMVTLNATSLLAHIKAIMSSPRLSNAMF